MTQVFVFIEEVWSVDAEVRCFSGVRVGYLLSVVVRPLTAGLLHL